MTAAVVVEILFLLVCAGCLVGVLAWLLSNSAQAALKTNLAKFLAKKFGVTLSVTDPTRADKRRSFWAVFIAIVSAVCLALAFVFKEVIMASVLYCAWIDAVSSATRLPPDVVNALTVVLVSLFAFVFLPFALGAKSETKSDHKRTRLLFAALFLAMFFFVKHFVSQPRPDEYFNSVTGASMWKYYISDEGLIVQAPLYKKFNTQDGSLLKLMDPSVAKAHREQEKKREEDAVKPSAKKPEEEPKKQSQPEPKAEFRLPNAHSKKAKQIANAIGRFKQFKTEPKWVSIDTMVPRPDIGFDHFNTDHCQGLVEYLDRKDNTYGPFHLWVERVHVAEDQTIVQVGVALPSDHSRKAVFHRFDFSWKDIREVAKLYDSNDKPYELESEEGEYDLIPKGASEFLCLAPCAGGIMMHPGERYRFLLSFPRLRTYWPDFELRAPHFPPITIKFVE